ncbi:hypothetical protein WJX72_006257 [[Myrmecia] bisecta]|uniref:VWFA domain-containing protein n=1 Tax=[Myrmecia] bisecta TaxID=41462 RepID=A0AAW1Q3H0_9CHLO
MDQPDAELLDPERYDAQEEGEEEVADLQAFQREYEDDHSWEMLQEDDQGLLRPLDIREEQRAKRRRLGAEASARIRRGMIRYLQIVVDLSRATSIADMRPSRIAVMSGVLQAFIRKFFDENPLSHIGILVMRNGKAKRLTELSGSPEAHISKLRESLDAGGDASLQNALDMAVDALKSVPPYGHREVLVLFAALSTCDPGEINDSIQAAKKHRCRVSIVGIAAEVYVCRRTTEETGGTYGVALNDKHLEELVLDHAPPPPAKASDAGASLVRMGFPKRNAEGPGTACFVGEECKLEAGGFTCPKQQGLSTLVKIGSYGQKIERQIRSILADADGLQASPTRLSSLLPKLHDLRDLLTSGGSTTTSFIETLRSLCKPDLMQLWVNFLLSTTPGALERCQEYASFQVGSPATYAHQATMLLVLLPVDFSSGSLTEDDTEDDVTEALQDTALDLFLRSGGLSYRMFQLQYMKKVIDNASIALTRHQTAVQAHMVSMVVLATGHAVMKLTSEEWRERPWVQQFLRDKFEVGQVLEVLCSAALTAGTHFATRGLGMPAWLSDILPALVDAVQHCPNLSEQVQRMFCNATPAGSLMCTLHRWSLEVLLILSNNPEAGMVEPPASICTAVARMVCLGCDHGHPNFAAGWFSLIKDDLGSYGRVLRLCLDAEGLAGVEGVLEGLSMVSQTKEWFSAFNGCRDRGEPRLPSLVQLLLEIIYLAAGAPAEAEEQLHTAASVLNSAVMVLYSLVRLVHPEVIPGFASSTPDGGYVFI